MRQSLLQKQTEAKRFPQPIGNRVIPAERIVGTYLTPALLVGLAIGFAVFAIYAGINITTIRNQMSAMQPTVNSVAISSTCNDSATQVRRAKAYQVRLDNAFANYAKPVGCHINNGDEALYNSTRFASFSKGLQHDNLGHVNPTAYAALLKAVASDLPSDWDAVPLASGSIRKLTNPQGGLGFLNEGGDPASFVVAPAPTFASAEQAGEMVEQYWMALARDVPFVDYATNNNTVAAVSSISGLSDYRGSPITANTLFRGTAPGCSVGPYISQFLYRPCPFGAAWIDQRVLPYSANKDYMTNWTTYLAQQNGQAAEAMTYGSTPVFIRNGRDLSRWVHVDVLFVSLFPVNTFTFNPFLPASIRARCSHLDGHGRAAQGGNSLHVFPKPGCLYYVWRSNGGTHECKKRHCRSQGKLVPKVEGSPSSQTRSLWRSRPFQQDWRVCVSLAF